MIYLNPFPLERGIHQGSPLSLLLFALIMESLVAYINENSAIDGWSIAGITEMSLYADDMLLYLADPMSYLDSLLDTVEEFSSYLGLRVNWTKYLLCPVDNLSIHEISVKSNLLMVDHFT